MDIVARHPEADLVGDAVPDGSGSSDAGISTSGDTHGRPEKWD